jgi:hypothetical protein
MKIVAMALIVTATLCNSTLAMAEGPVPFRALMQTANGQPSVTPIPDAKGQSAVSTQPARTPHMTTAGKVMTGAGIGMFAIGVVAIAGTAALRGWATPSDKAKLFGAGGGAVASGVVLIVLGDHRRSTK